MQDLSIQKLLTKELVILKALIEKNSVEFELILDPLCKLVPIFKSGQPFKMVLSTFIPLASKSSKAT